MLVTKQFHQLAPMEAPLPISKDAPDEKPMEVKGPLGQVGTHLKSVHVKRQANRRRWPAAL